MMRILALDLGTKTGYALGAVQADIVSGSKDWATKRIEGGGMRFLKFRNWLKSLDLKPGDAVVFEEVRNHSSVGAAHVYGGFMTEIMTFCDELRIPYQSVPVGVIKKHASGKGNTKKDGMIRAAFNLFEILADDDNHADALALWHYARFVLYPEKS